MFKVTADKDNVRITQHRSVFTKPLLLWENNKYFMFLCVCVCVCLCAWVSARMWVHGRGVCLRSCSLTYPTCHAHVPYCLRPVSVHSIFRHFLINDTIFGKKLLNIKCVFWSSPQLLFEMFLILGKIRRDIFMNVKTSVCKALRTRYSWRNLMKLESSR